MATLNFINYSMIIASRHLANRQLDFILGAVFSFLFVIFTMLGVWKTNKNLKSIWHKLLRFLFAIISCLFIVPITVIFLTAGEIIEVVPSISSIDFYIEIIIISSITVFLYCLTIYRSNHKNKPSDSEDAEETLSGVLKGLVIVGLSLLFIFTDMEFYIQEWGFSLFGKKIGEWIFNAYLSWTAYVLLGIVQAMIQLPFMFIFGNPFNYIEKAFDD